LATGKAKSWWQSGQRGSTRNTFVYAASHIRWQTFPMSTIANGAFEVRTQPLSQDDPAPGFGRLALEKTYSGDLAGAGQGVMLTAMTPTPGAAAYVAIERVTGKLHGREGSFALQHAGSMCNGEQQLAICVVPCSGTGELAGIEGQLDIRIENGQHFYEFEYTLPE
jgi:hypothetical protein